jgi:chemotaxis protein MotD
MRDAADAANIASQPAGPAGIVPTAAGGISNKSLIIIVFHRFRRWPDDCRTDDGNPENQTVPTVASEATVPAYKPSLPNPAWAAPSSGRVSDSPFDALLDTSTQAAVEPPQSPPPPSNNTLPKVQSDSGQSSDQDTAQNPAQASANAPAKAPAKDPAKTADTGTDQPSDSTNASDTVDAAAFDTAIKEFKAAKVGQDAKTDKTGKQTDKQTAAGENPKPASTVKQADAVAPANPAVTTATNAIQTALPVAVIAPVVVAQDVPAPVLQAVAAISPLSIAGAETTKTKSTGGTAAKPDAAKLTTDTKVSVQPADGKPQAVAGDTDRLAAAPQHDAAQSSKSHGEAAPAQPSIATDAQVAAPKVDGSALQQAALSVQAPDASQNVAAPAAPAPQGMQAIAVPLGGVAVEIAGKALEGKNHFEIRLDPPELGRIEVRLAVDKDGNTTTHMIADRSDTLNLLRNDSSDLQRALQDAGLKTSDNGLQFSLRDQSMGQQQSNAPTPSSAQIVVNDDVLAATDITPRSYLRLAGMGGGIDIRV